MSNSEILREFLLETHENLALLDSDLIALEKNPADKATLAQVFRTLHSVKGTAGFMGLAKLQTVAHAAESLLSKLRSGDLRFTPTIATALLRVVDAIREILANIETTNDEGGGDYSAIVEELERLRDGGDSSSSGPVPPLPAPSAPIAPVAPVAPLPSPAPPVAPPAMAPSPSPPSPPSVPSAPPVAIPPAMTPAIAPAPPAPPKPAPPQPAIPTTYAPAASPAPAPPPAPVPFVAPAPPAPSAVSTTSSLTFEVSAPHLPVAESYAGGATIDLSPHERLPAPTKPVAPLEPSPSTPSAGTDHRLPAVAETNIRVDVGLLDNLMTLVGELVLARNQILQYSAAHEDDAFLNAVQRLNLLTTELQAGVMKTRMQPIGNVLGKFPRIVRDMAIACGKQVRFEMEGDETELDRSLLEAIRDPLTHMVRNAIDHGIETPEARRAAGKPEEGLLRMVACHEGGKVVIEISDDGAGIDLAKVTQKAIAAKLISPEVAARLTRPEILRLLFLPGFSTAEKVTQFSGRGVGMDVVRTNIEKIGGTVEIESTWGAGTTIRTSIPLTLAIIPALTIDCGGQRYAIPQISLLELVRLDAEQAARSIERIQGAAVYRLRGSLLPLVFLDEQLELKHSRDPSLDLSIVVLQADDRPFGLVVDAIRDTEEIVVKPLQKQLKGISVFAGAAIMGDGRVALVLDVLGVARRAGVVSGAREQALGERKTASSAAASAGESLLLFEPRAGGRMAIPLSLVARLEEFPRGSLEQLGAGWVVQYRNAILPLVDVSQTLDELPGATRAGRRTGELPDSISVVVHSAGEQHVGLLVDRIVDIVQDAEVERSRATRPGVLFTAIVQQRVTEFVDMSLLVSAARAGPAPALN